jgi:PPM family protein phosphatase
MAITYAKSDVGLVRTNNEDSYLADGDSGLVIVADGMGGHAAGEIASQLAVETISAKVRGTSFFWPFQRAQRERDLLIEAIRSANRRVREQAAEEAAMRGMGTTVVVLWLRGRRAHVAHVGDSRIYRFRRGGLVQLTRDHSWPSEDGAMRNVLTRAVGAENEVEVDHKLVETTPGDIFLLCSDGLTRTVDDAAIIAALREFKTPPEAAGRLIEMAKANGAPDNVTVALVYC